MKGLNYFGNLCYPRAGLLINRKTEQEIIWESGKEADWREAVVRGESWQGLPAFLCLKRPDLPIALDRSPASHLDGAQDSPAGLCCLHASLPSLHYVLGPGPPGSLQQGTLAMLGPHTSALQYAKLSPSQDWLPIDTLTITFSEATSSEGTA